MKPIYALLIIILFCQTLFAEETGKEIFFPDHHLCLEASGKVVLKADKAVFSFYTQGYGSSLRDAVTKAKAKVMEVTSSLNQIGIGNECFATGSFATGKNYGSFIFSDKKDYKTSLTTTVTLRDLTKIDDAILILADKKVDNISYITYSLDNQAQAKQQAREVAFNRICEQRDTISRILGVTITDIQLIDEEPFDQLPWNTQDGVYSNAYYKGGRSSSMNTVTKEERVFEFVPYEDTPEPYGGIYAPEITVMTKVRVLYRVGLKQVK